MFSDPHLQEKGGKWRWAEGKVSRNAIMQGAAASREVLQPVPFRGDLSLDKGVGYLHLQSGQLVAWASWERHGFDSAGQLSVAKSMPIEGSLWRALSRQPSSRWRKTSSSPVQEMCTQNRSQQPHTANLSPQFCHPLICTLLLPWPFCQASSCLPSFQSPECRQGANLAWGTGAKCGRLPVQPDFQEHGAERARLPQQGAHGTPLFCVSSYAGRDIRDPSRS